MTRADTLASPSRHRDRWLCRWGLAERSPPSPVFGPVGFEVLDIAESYGETAIRSGSVSVLSVQCRHAVHSSEVFTHLPGTRS